MTLARGNHVVKLGADGKPLTTDQEIYIEYEVMDLSAPIYRGNDQIDQFVVLRKVR